LAADRRTLLVAHADIERAAQLGDDIEARRAAVWVVEPGALLGTGPASARAVTVCAAPFALAYAAGDARAFVTCTGEDSVAVLDPAHFAVPARIPITAPRGGVTKPYAAATDPARQRLVVSSAVSRAVSLVGMNEMAVGWTVAFDGTPGVPSGVPYFAAWPTDSTIVVPVQSPDGAVLLDSVSGTVLVSTTYSADDCALPRQAVVGAGGRLFLVCEGDHFSPGRLVELDATTLAVTRSVTLELAPDRMAVLPKGGGGP
jgi:DNA-binding beta-propeller fold protein YncE